MKSRRAAVKQKLRLKSQLPEEIIQHIQSFMSAKEAARAALLSKTWHRAWSTRPVVFFNQSSFPNEGFGELARKTMQRYEDLNLNIQTFSLRTQRYRDHSLAAELIPKAFKLGAIHLEIQTPVTGLPPFVLPHEVLQSETLVTLCVYGCTIDRVLTNCPNLKYLKLSNLTANPHIIRDLISGCPLIEELTLERLRWEMPLPFDVATLLKLHKLESLRLEGLDFGDSLCRSELWPKFACLKVLEIVDFYPYSDHRVLRICSTSLELIVIDAHAFNGQFDVPNLKSFWFKGDALPQIELRTSSNTEAGVEIRCQLRYEEGSASWFSSLSELVRKLELCHSRVSLSVSLAHRRHGDGDGYVGDGLDIPALEHLTIKGCPVSPGVLEAFFRSCRPKFVSIERRCLSNVEVFQQLRSLPRKPLLDASRTCKEFFCFQLNYY